jgi:hypothetical protein
VGARAALAGSSRCPSGVCAAKVGLCTHRLGTASPSARPPDFGRSWEPGEFEMEFRNVKEAARDLRLGGGRRGGRPGVAGFALYWGLELHVKGSDEFIIACGTP